MRGMVANPYIAMANGSPWVVPSCDKMTSPSIKSSNGLRYELIKMVAMEGHSRLMLWRATLWLRTLKAFAASTIRTASQS